ncbi:multiheme c-type cytochrome [Corallococcus sp. bb12-1]|uniref:multiheme c-type cytochrome n=1 Tax=Corallococcus sp. bb12-1 TaxID=2996784 RepID=UPI00226E6B18|nr:multiheme c-type cytochrome [Corallococcus sp. bb12-1]MCY1045480.1 multiheme c-type cytochrome [Corallococcus sp. bb12-1]
MFALLLTCSLLAAAPSARFPQGTARMEPGPAPHGLPDWDVRRCEECHAEQVTQWRASGHATARTDDVFQVAITEDRPAWCVQCHAPFARNLKRGALPPDSPAEERGVTCAGCHAPLGDAMGAQAMPCAGCHQFGFPVLDSGGRRQRLSATQSQQDTVGEWTRWREQSGDTRHCTACHMPRGDHGLGGTRRTDSLKAALKVEQVRGALLLSLRDVGHAFPTGDVMRWVGVEVANEPLFESPRTVATFGRKLELRSWPGEALPHLGAVEDTRLLPGQTRRVPLPPGARYARIVYHLVSRQQEDSGLYPAGLSRLVLWAAPLQSPPTSKKDRTP